MRPTVARQTTSRTRRASCVTTPTVGQFRLHVEQRRPAVQPARRAGVGRFRQRKDSRARGIRHVLFVDRRSRIPDEFTAAATTARPLSRILPCLRSRRFPFTPGVAPPPSCGPGVPTPCTTFAPQGIQANAKTPAVQEWNLAVEQQLTRNTSRCALRMSDRSASTNCSASIPTPLPAQICATATCVVRRQRRRVTGIVSPGRAVHSRSRHQAAQLQFSAAGFFWLTEGNSSYNALQADVTHRISKGLEFRGNYTWSKNLDMNSGIDRRAGNNQAQMVLESQRSAQGLGPVRH